MNPTCRELRFTTKDDPVWRFRAGKNPWSRAVEPFSSRSDNGRDNWLKGCSGPKSR